MAAVKNGAGDPCGSIACLACLAGNLVGNGEGQPRLPGWTVLTSRPLRVAVPRLVCHGTPRNRPPTENLQKQKSHLDPKWLFANDLVLETMT